VRVIGTRGIVNINKYIDTIIVFIAAPVAFGGDLAGRTLPITTVRTGDTEMFAVDLDSGDARNLSRSLGSEDRYPCWSPDGKEVVDVADAAPGSNGRDVFTADNRISYDPSGPSGKNWKWVAHTLDPFRSPDDLRLHFPGLQCGTSVRKLGDKLFLCQ
jgi:hypothetical protein